MSKKDKLQALKELLGEDSKRKNETMPLELEDKVLSHTITLCDKHFTEEEIGLLVDFFTSPVGKRLMEFYPFLMRERLKFLLMNR